MKFAVQKYPQYTLEKKRKKLYWRIMLYCVTFLVRYIIYTHCLLHHEESLWRNVSVLNAKSFCFDVVIIHLRQSQSLEFVDSRISIRINDLSFDFYRTIQLKRVYNFFTIL